MMDYYSVAQYYNAQVRIQDIDHISSSTDYPHKPTILMVSYKSKQNVTLNEDENVAKLCSIDASLDHTELPQKSLEDEKSVSVPISLFYRYKK